MNSKPALGRPDSEICKCCKTCSADAYCFNCVYNRSEHYRKALSEVKEKLERELVVMNYERCKELAKEIGKTIGEKVE